MNEFEFFPKRHRQSTDEAVIARSCDEQAAGSMRARNAGNRALPGITYDIGVESLAACWQGQLGVPTVSAAFPILLIDPDRGETTRRYVMKISDGAIIPGIRSAMMVEPPRQKRSVINRLLPRGRAAAITPGGTPAREGAPLVLSLHSFTPSWRCATPGMRACSGTTDHRADALCLQSSAGMTFVDQRRSRPYDSALKGRHALPPRYRASPHCLKCART